MKQQNPPPFVPTAEINFSTYLGNDLADVARDVERDSAGNLFVVGGALSANLLPGAPTRALAGDEDAFVAKFDATGQVVWWTFLGGPGPDRGYALEIDPNGDLVIGGSAAAQFPVTPGAALTQFQGGAGTCDPNQLAAQCTVSTTNPARDGFVAKLSGVNGALVWATYFGSGRFEADSYVDVAGTEDDNVTDFNDDNDPRSSVVRDIAVDPTGGEIYLTFAFQSSSTRLPADAGTPATTEAIDRNLPPVILAALLNGDQPVSPALDTGLGSGPDEILAKLSTDGSSLLWATFVGGRSAEGTVMLVRLDAQANPVVLTTTTSLDLVTAQDPITKVVSTTAPIVVNGFDDTLARDGQLFVTYDFYLAKYALNGPLIWSTYYGGRGAEVVESGNLAVSPNTIVIAAQTNSGDFTPLNGSSFDPTFNGTTLAGGYFSGDCGIATIAPDGDALLATTFYGGAGGDACAGVALDSQDRVYVTGGTTSTDLPIRSGPLQNQRPGPFSSFLAVFSADLSQLLHSGYFGGTGIGNSHALLVRNSSATEANVIFAGAAEAGYPLTPSPGTPARASVTAPPGHGVLSDVRIDLD